MITDFRSDPHTIGTNHDTRRYDLKTTGPNALVPVPQVPWFPKDIEAWTVRWVLVHLIEETARHWGHADIVRETVDGAQALELLAAVENWPEEGGPVKPWRRAQ